jgi:DNA-binding HxlR family transcriptional regulator
MSRDCQKNLQMARPSAAVLLPPALVDETGWDILLALHSDRGGLLRLDKLAAVVSASRDVMSQWLSALEEQHLITGDVNPVTSELRAKLTEVGRELLDRYLTVASDLQVATHR